MRKSKAVILLGMGVIIAASYMNAAHPSHFPRQKPAVGISGNVGADRVALVSSDDWGSPRTDVRDLTKYR
jgi:hypothetical protein